MLLITRGMPRTTASRRRLPASGANRLTASWINKIPGSTTKRRDKSAFQIDVPEWVSLEQNRPANEVRTCGRGSDPVPQSDIVLSPCVTCTVVFWSTRRKWLCRRRVG